MIMIEKLKEKKKKQTSKWLYIGLFLLVCVLAAPAMAVDRQINILAHGDYAYCNDVNGANITASTGPAGTGQFDPFLTFNVPGSQQVEQGYNSVSNTEMDAFYGGGRTHPIKLSSIPEFNVGGTLFRKFNLDVNEQGNEKANISVGMLRVYVGDINNPNSYNVNTGIFGNAPTADLVWDLDRECKNGYDDVYIAVFYKLETGSGRSDLSLFVPETSFDKYTGCGYGADATCNNWVYLFAKMGDPGASTPGTSPQVLYLGNDGGFEEWGVEVTPIPPDLSITKVDSPDPVIVGNTVTYTITGTKINWYQLDMLSRWPRQCQSIQWNW
jgi:hypothetical protein